MTARLLPDPKPWRLAPDVRIFAHLLQSAEMRAGLSKADRHGTAHSTAGRATRERVDAVRTNEHAHRSGRWRLPKSIEAFALGDRQCFGNIVDAGYF